MRIQFLRFGTAIVNLSVGAAGRTENGEDDKKIYDHQNDEHKCGDNDGLDPPGLAFVPDSKHLAKNGGNDFQ
jgi:hypothetical protein